MYTQTMTMKDFTLNYIDSGKIRLWGDYKLLLSRVDLQISEEYVSAAALGEFFVPRYVDARGLLIEGFEAVRDNPSASLVTLKMASMGPEGYKLSLGGRTLPDPTTLTPVPIATDTSSNRTLILDLNHRLSNMYDQLINDIPVVHLKGDNLIAVFNDFEAINNLTTKPRKI